MGALVRWSRPLVLSGLSVLAASAVYGWGRELPTEKDDYVFLNETEASDLMGRWRIVAIAHQGVDEKKPVSAIDIVPCGSRYCGVAVGTDGTCGSVVLSFEDRGPTYVKTGANDVLERFAGSLDWHDATAKYVVYVDVDQEDNAAIRPLKNAGTKLSISGSSDGSYGRAFPLEIATSYSGAAICKAPTS